MAEQKSDDSENRDVNLSGYQFLESRRSKKDRKHLANKVDFSVDEAARVNIEGVGTGKSFDYATKSSHVMKFLRMFEKASWDTSSDFIGPYTKEMQVGPKKAKRVAPNDLVECPSCEGEGWLDCFLCNGAKRVTTKQARAFKSAYE